MKKENDKFLSRHSLAFFDTHWVIIEEKVRKKGDFQEKWQNYHYFGND